MKPFDFLLSHLCPDLEAAVDFRNTYPGSDDEFIESLSKQYGNLCDNVIGLGRVPDPEGRILAAALIRNRHLDDADSIYFIHELAFNDKNGQVRGFAWLGIAEHWRRNDQSPVLLRLASEDYRWRFGVDSLAIIDMNLSIWLDAIVHMIDYISWKNNRPVSASSGVADASDPQLLRDLDSLSRNPVLAVKFLGDSSAVRRLAAITCLSVVRDPPIIPSGTIESLMRCDPDRSVRAMALKYWLSSRTNEETNN